MYKTLRWAISKHPKLREDDAINPKRFPGSFEDALLMAIRKNNLVPHRLNLENPYLMDGRIETLDGKILTYYDVEYAHSKLFDSNGKFLYYDVHVPIEKRKYFLNYPKSVYVRGNLEYVVVLRGEAIIKYGKPIRKTVKHGVSQIEEERDFIKVHFRQAASKNHLKTCKLPDWLNKVKEMYPLEYSWLV